jgi:hypothetical protein
LSRLEVLVDAALDSRRREAQWRPCHLEAGPRVAAADSLENYRRFWKIRYRQLDTLPKEMNGNPNVI